MWIKGNNSKAKDILFTDSKSMGLIDFLWYCCVLKEGEMTKPKYPIGYKFNKLTIVEYLGHLDKKSHHCYYLCQCECGKKVKILTHHIQIQKSCGCAPRVSREL